MRRRNIIWAITLIVLCLALVMPITYGSLIFSVAFGPAAMLLGVGFLLFLCVLALLFALKKRR